VYEAIVTWTKFDESNRKNNFSRLLKFINFEKLPNEYFQNVITNEQLIKSDLTCSNMVLTALCKIMNQNASPRKESKISSSVDEVQLSDYFKSNDEVECIPAPKTIQEAYQEAPRLLVGATTKSDNEAKCIPPPKTIQEAYQEASRLLVGATTSSVARGAFPSARRKKRTNVQKNFT